MHRIRGCGNQPGSPGGTPPPNSAPPHPLSLHPWGQCRGDPGPRHKGGLLRYRGPRHVGTRKQGYRALTRFSLLFLLPPSLLYSLYGGNFQRPEWTGGCTAWAQGSDDGQSGFTCALPCTLNPRHTSSPTPTPSKASEIKNH